MLRLLFIAAVGALCCGIANAAETPQVARGHYLATMGDCVVCQELADVATYIRNSWGNRAEPVSIGEVRSLRKILRSRE